MDLISRLASEANEEAALILATKVPPTIQGRILVKPDVFSRLANCDNLTLKCVLSHV